MNLEDRKQGTRDRDSPWHLAYERKGKKQRRKKKEGKMFEVETDLGLAARLRVGMSRWLAWASHTDTVKYSCRVQL